jgi:hypothetical protein
MKKIVTRLVATFGNNVLVVVGGASLLGGIAVWKAAVLAGVASLLPIVQKLAVGYMNDGVLTDSEADEAFGN